MTAPELKPCPFCGGTDLYWPHGTDPAIIQCGGKDGCGARSGVPDDQNEAEAIAAWNRRADLAAVQPAQVQPDQTVEIDLRAAMMEELEKAASESPWVPKEYYMNEVISDCCAFLREDRTPQPDPRDEVVKMMPEVIAALRSDGLNVSLVSDLVAALAAAKAVQHD